MACGALTGQILEGLKSLNFIMVLLLPMGKVSEFVAGF